MDKKEIELNIELGETIQRLSNSKDFVRLVDLITNELLLYKVKDITNTSSVDSVNRMNNEIKWRNDFKNHLKDVEGRILYNKDMLNNINKGK